MHEFSTSRGDSGIWRSRIRARRAQRCEAVRIHAGPMRGIDAESMEWPGKASAKPTPLT